MNIYVPRVVKISFSRDESVMRALAKFRGVAIGVEYTEAFMLIREVL